MINGKWKIFNYRRSSLFIILLICHLLITIYNYSDLLHKLLKILLVFCVFISW
jgi:hypothetical protein